METEDGALRLGLIGSSSIFIIDLFGSLNPMGPLQLAIHVVLTCDQAIFFFLAGGGGGNAPYFFLPPPKKNNNVEKHGEEAIRNAKASSKQPGRLIAGSTGNLRNESSNLYEKGYSLSTI